MQTYHIFLNSIGISFFGDKGALSKAACDKENVVAFNKFKNNSDYREDYLAAKEWFDILSSHNFQLPTKKVDKLISIHKELSNLK